MKKYLLATALLLIMVFNTEGQGLIDSLFEDVQFITQNNKEGIFFTSSKVDFLQIQSTITDSVEFAIIVYKPQKPSPILLLSHGWHGSVKPPKENPENLYNGFLTIQVDMRGRKYSTGTPDCNGYELYDFYDAYKYAVSNYKSYISDTNQVYYLGGSGGGGNGFALIGKFPDLFCSAVISCGMSDYAEWYKGDSIGEFRDELIPWIGCAPEQNPEAYQSRSGITTVKNILTPAYIVHGETDVRVPVSHSRNFVQKGKEYGKEINYLELKGVGTRSHWGNITDEQKSEKTEVANKGLEKKNPPALPDKGELVVAGYIVTKYFSVFLDSIDDVGMIEYDLKERKIEFKKGKGSVIWE